VQLNGIAVQWARSHCGADPDGTEGNPRDGCVVTSQAGWSWTGRIDVARLVQVDNAVVVA